MDFLTNLYRNKANKLNEQYNVLFEQLMHLIESDMIPADKLVDIFDRILSGDLTPGLGKEDPAEAKKRLEKVKEKMKKKGADIPEKAPATEISIETTPETPTESKPAKSIEQARAEGKARAAAKIEELRKQRQAAKAKQQPKAPETTKQPPKVAEPVVQKPAAPSAPAPEVSPAKPSKMAQAVEKIGSGAEKVAGKLESEAVAKGLKSAGEAIKGQFQTPISQYPKALGKEVGGAIKNIFTPKGALGLGAGIVAGELVGKGLEAAGVKSELVKTPAEWAAMGATDIAVQQALTHGVGHLGTRAGLAAIGGGAAAGAGLAAAGYGGYEVGKFIGQSKPVQALAAKAAGIESIRKTEGQTKEQIDQQAKEIKAKAAEARKKKQPSTEKSWSDYLPDLSGFLPS